LLGLEGTAELAVIRPAEIAPRFQRGRAHRQRERRGRTGNATLEIEPGPLPYHLEVGAPGLRTETQTEICSQLCGDLHGRLVVSTSCTRARCQVCQRRHCATGVCVSSLRDMPQGRNPWNPGLAKRLSQS